MIPAITSKIYSTLGSNSSLVPLAIKDIANSAGLTAGSYITGQEVEGKDRFIDEFGTQAIWLFGIPFFKKLTDYTLYKVLGVDPKFDVRNFKNKDILAKAVEKAPTKKIKESMLKAIENPRYTKNLALGKFAFSTIAAIGAYTGLTKFRQKYRLNEAKAKLKENTNHSQQNETALHNTPQAFEGIHKQKGKNIAFGGAVQNFMFNPVKNLMILDGAITEERLRSSESKQEFINYAIKEGGTWTFMYFAGDLIRKHLEKKAFAKGTPIALDSRIIESQELKDAFKLGTLKTSIDEFAKKLPAKPSDLDIYNFIHENPDNFVVKMAKKSSVIKTLKKSEQIDTRAYLDIDEFKGLKQSIEELYNKAPKDKLDDYIKNVIKTKRASVLKNMGICIGALGIAVPLTMIAMRYILPNNKEYKVMEKAKQETGLSKA